MKLSSEEKLSSNEIEDAVLQAALRGIHNIRNDQMKRLFAYHLFRQKQCKIGSNFNIHQQILKYDPNLEEVTALNLDPGRREELVRSHNQYRI